MTIVPNRMGIGIHSPALDKKGNSIAAVKALELLSNKLELSIFLNLKDNSLLKREVTDEKNW